MKWPASITLIRHGQSVYNALRHQKDTDIRYGFFKEAYRRDHTGAEARDLATEMSLKYRLDFSDYETPLTQEGENQARATGSMFRGVVPKPDMVFYSPYKRAKDTFFGLSRGYGDLGSATFVAEDRIREQEHGLSLLYSDWRIFHVMHPEQKRLRELLGPYWYQYPQGESVSQVRDRTRDLLSMLVRECAGKHVWLVTHHLTILSLRANLERLAPEEFIRLDRDEKPINGGVTLYRGYPNEGVDGKLRLEYYNRQFYL